MSTYINDLASNTTRGTSLGEGVAKTATANGTGVDMVHADGLCHVMVVNGVVTDGVHTITVQESDDNTTFTAVTLNQSLSALSSNSTAGAIQFANFSRSKRYVRGVTTVANGSSGGYYSVHFLGQTKFVVPS